METLTIAVELIRRHEGLRLEAYRCPAGVWTIGYGHTAGTKPGMRISATQAESMLQADVASVISQIERLERRSGTELNANRRAALASFAFNTGFHALEKSTLWAKISRNPDDESIAAEFARWKYASGKVMAGLVRRRTEEAALYFAR